LAAVGKDGVCLTLYVSASAVLDEAGAPTCLMASFLDITQRKAAGVYAAAERTTRARAEEPAMPWTVSSRRRANDASARAEELVTPLDAVPTPVIIVHDPDGTHMTGDRAAGEQRPSTGCV
jgi:hypothetical protein